MTRTGITVGAVALLAGVTAAEPLTPPQLDALSGLDVVITQPLIEGAFDPDPVDELIALAHNTGKGTDTGVRLRAFRALSLYPEAEAVLAADILAASTDGTGTEAATPGERILLLRAQIEALGELERSLGASTYYDVLLKHLGHQSRDIRAATADALRVMGATGAIDALYDRLNVETSEQVELAINRALRELSPLQP
jgi:hypothetical protein